MLELEKKIQETNPDYGLGAFLAIDAGLDSAVIQETQEALGKYDMQDIENEYPDPNEYPHPYFLGYGLWLMGESEKAEYYFKLEILQHEETLKLNEPYMHSGLSIDAAKAYAFTGDTEKACECLEAILNRYRIVSSVFFAMIKFSPLFDPIRDEPCYQDIMQKMEANRKAEHDRVRRWLEETGRMDQFSHLR